VAKVMEEGGSTLNERVRLVYTRHGFPEETWFTWSFGPIYDESGRVGGLFNTCHEDTQQVLAERERDRLATHRQLALDAARLGWWHYDPATKVATFDQRYTEIFSVTGHQRPNEEILKRLHPDDLPGVWAKVEAALDPADPKPYAAEYRIVLDDGSVRWVEAHGTATFEGEGAARRAVSFVGTVADVTERRRADAATRDAELRYRAVFESSRDGKIIYTPEGTIVDANPAACKMYGYAHDEIVGVHAPTAMHPDALPTFREFQRVAGSGGEFQSETVDRRRDGTTFPIEVIGTPLTINGQPHLMSVIRDITERKQAEEQLRRSHDTFYNLIQNNPFGVYVVDADFRLRQVSLGSRKVFGGISPLLGRDFAEVLRAVWAEPFASEAIARFRHTLDTGEPFASPSTVEQRQGTGEVEGYDWRIERITLPDGRFGVVCYFYDLSERLQWEEAIRASEARFRQLADAMPQIVWVTRPDGYHEYYNQRWYEFTGVPEGSTDGEGWNGMFHPEDQDRAWAAWRRSLDTGEPYEVEYRLRHRSGEYRWTLGRALPIRDASGAITKWFGTCTDIDAIKRLQQEREHLLASEQAARVDAERAGRMKDEFLATLSHELRTPLNAILGWATILSGEGAAGPDDLREGLEAIERNARSQTQIIEDLLDMSRIISGKVRLDVQQVDLAAVVRGAVETVKHAADAKAIRVHAVLDPLDGPVFGDPGRLQQVFWNLLTNAIKFTAKGGRVQVLLERVNSHVEVRVTDTGEGIRPEFLPHVFDRFKQADASTTRRHGGLGLGLGIVKQLVELHGGTVTVKSAGVGCGSTFVVTLPVTPLRPDAHEEPERRHPESSNAAAPFNTDLCKQIAGLKVLVVDDEADSRAVVQRLLEACNAVVLASASAADALERVAAERPDVLVSDIGMPGEDGYSLIRRVRALGPERGGNVPAVALTAYARSEDRTRSILAGFQMHIAKPVEPSELIAMVASLAGRTR